MNIIDYVTKFGDKRFSERPLGEIDGLIFTELSYLNFTGLVDMTPSTITLGELAVNVDRLVSDTLLPQNNVKLLDVIRRSERFAPVRVGCFREENDEKREMRFAAVTFYLPDGAEFVAYRGTDITLLGWKEDFNMAFRRHVPSQKLAVEYLKQVASKERCPLYIGGHSKGGNLALYAAVNAGKRIQRRTVAVYNFDGPGFHESIFERPEYLSVADRVCKAVPHDSLIGILLFHSEKYKVVESRSVLIGQHDPFAWAVKDENGFVELPETTRNSRHVDATMRVWLEGMEPDERRKFVNTLFKVIGGSGAATVPQLFGDLWGAFRKMRQTFKELTEEEREIIGANGKKLLRLWLRSVRGVLA